MRVLGATLNMPDVPLSEVCVCGGTEWHAMIDRVIWCRRCGSVRLIFETYWKVPLDRAGELSSTVVVVERDEPPTNPFAMKRRSDEDEF